MDHTLNMVELYHDLIAAGDQLRLVGDQVQYRPHQGQSRNETIATLRQHKDELAAWLRTRTATETAYPLSQGQLGLWLDWQRNPETPFYNLVTVARLHADVQVDILHQAAQLLWDRHPALRAVYSLTAEGPQQQVQMHQNVDFVLIDGVTWTEAAVQAWIADEADHSFDLTTGPMMRMRLLQCLSDTTDGAQPHYLLHWTFHHIATDLFTLEILQDELYQCYHALCIGEQPRLAMPSLTQRDFVRWEEETLRVHEGRLAAFWRNQLGDEPVLLNLPVKARTEESGQPRPEGPRRCQSVDFSFEPQLVQQLRAYARANRVTLYTLLLAAYQVLLSRYTGQEHFFIASPTTVRELAGWRDTVGYFINAILLQADLASETGQPLDFVTLLRRTHETVTAAKAHHLYPYHAMLRQWHRRITPEQLQQGVVGFLFEPMRRPIRNNALFAKVLMQEQRSSPEPMSLFIFEFPDQLAGRITYHTNLFDRAFIERMAEHFTVLLKGIVTQPEKPVLHLPLLTAAEYHQLVHEWNATAVDFGPTQTIQALFAAQVARTPDAVAVVVAEDRETERQGDKVNKTITVTPSPCHPLTLSYAELNTRANHLAHYLQGLGVGPDVVVGLLAPRGIDFLTAMLAIFKAGGAYLPLEPRNPTARHAQILLQSQSPLVLCAESFLPELQETLTGTLTAAHPLPTLLSLEASLAQVTTPTDPAIDPQPHHLAYVIFTSGSTGLPKGAMVEQRGMVNHLFAKIQDLALVATDRVAQTASQAFDISVWQFLAALVVGGRVYIYPDEISLDPDRLLHQVENDQITIWETVPSLMRALLDSLLQTQPSAPQSNIGLTQPHLQILAKMASDANLPLSVAERRPGGEVHSLHESYHNQPRPEKRFALSALRWLIPTGEALPPTLANQWLTLYPRIPLLNAYGPTECSDDVTHYPIYEPLPPTVVNTPIGRPVCNMRAYILDRAMQPTPIGVPGELWIGGVGVGRGYLHDPQRTAAAFVADPFAAAALDGNAPPRLYKTGDLARWLSNEATPPVIEFLGRADFQVKIHGFRIELGEIESALLAQASVREAVVLAREDNPGDKRLVAYLVGEAESDILRQAQDTALRQAQDTALRQQLAQRLPEYMIPAAFVMLEAMPLTPNGKIDRRALPAPTLVRDTATIQRPRTLLEQKIAQVWEQTLGVSPIGIHDNFFAIGGHSLLAVQLLAKLQPLLQQPLPLRTLFAAPTVAQLATLVAQDGNVRIADATTALIVLQPQGAAPPLTCLPGVGVGPLYLQALAQRLGNERPVYTVEPLGLDGKTPPLTTVEAIAAYHVAHLQQQQPCGPYHLGGHSFGGLVAYEMAQQLHKAGATVGAVLLLDTDAPTGQVAPRDEVEIMLFYERLVCADYGLSPTLTAAHLQPLNSEARLCCLQQALETAGLYPPNTPLAQLRGIIQVAAADLQAAAAYRPTNFVRLPLQLFVARDAEREAAATQAMIAGWASYGDVTVHEAPGTHTTMMVAPQVQVLAAQVQSCLTAIERANA